ncbi:4'-phosphopantetheinyl transferase superfamily protein [Variovorax sp. J22R115]|uniref:4'-phosphopantetheinyl transferase family protein n=1 Tax=Variovorax sp. J22R115 TaxID=3053509 RepID=UPI0025783B60|nr:4'-phosphopantetheinyl transferase superfamily protein [Variovorax sp. J22R115]MDM0053050.1 4'-phosphopantetheinyl transferase superfamily protein [Variovorax sp. J22R115]
MGPEPLPLAHDDIHLWSANLDLPAGEVATLAGCLSPDERDRAARFHFERDRRRFVVGRATLRIVLSRYGSGEAAARLRLRYGAQGKPALDRAQARHEPPIEFNLAHSQELVLIAVAAGRALGVDVEFVRPIDDLEGMARQVCTTDELRSLLGMPTALRGEAFLRCWTRKEACLKAIGTGLSFPLEHVQVGCTADAPEPPGWTLHDLRPAPGFLGALVTRRGACRITRFGFDARHPTI